MTFFLSKNPENLTSDSADVRLFYLEIFGCDVVILVLDLLQSSCQVRQVERTLSRRVSCVDLLHELFDFLERKTSLASMKTKCKINIRNCYVKMLSTC